MYIIEMAKTHQSWRAIDLSLGIKIDVNELEKIWKQKKKKKHMGCSRTIEDEIHILIEYPAYDDLRRSFTKAVDIELPVEDRMVMMKLFDLAE